MYLANKLVIAKQVTVATELRQHTVDTMLADRSQASSAPPTERLGVCAQ